MPASRYCCPNECLLAHTGTHTHTHTHTHTQIRDGLNDPDGDVFAAVKNCIECGYAPGRAPECTPAEDGSFAIDKVVFQAVILPAVGPGLGTKPAVSHACRAVDIPLASVLSPSELTE